MAMMPMMSAKQVGAILALLLGTFLVVRAGLGTRLPPADLRFGNASEPQTLDPAKMTGVPEGRIARALFEGLTYPNLSDLTRPKPGAAMRWERSADGLTYTFYLREGARWSNGAPVTADHFLFSWQRVLAPNTGSQYAELLWPVKHARAFNLQLIYLTRATIPLREAPDPASTSRETLPKGTPLLRVDLDQKEVRSARVVLSEGPDQSPADQHLVATRGMVVHVLARKLHGAHLWYKIRVADGKEGWLRGVHLHQTSKRYKPKQAKYFFVRSLEQPHRHGWVSPRLLTQPNYTFPPKAPKKRQSRPLQPVLTNAWRYVGLKVKAVKKPLPKGYTPKALGQRLIFEVTLESPTAFFTQLASFYSLVPVYPPLVKRYPRRWVLPKHCIGNGPFRLTHWMINDLVRVEKNPHYWNAKQVKLNSVHFLALTERDTQLSMYLAGDLDVISNNIPLPTVEKLRGRPDFHSRPYLGNYFYRFNVTQPPLNNKHFRQALAWAVDRKSIAKYILRGGQRPAYGLVPPGIRGYPPIDSIGPGFSPKKARQLLAKAGFPNGKKVPALSLLYNTDQQHKKIAEALQKMWSQHLGLTVNLVNKEWKTFLDATKKKEYQIARAGWIGDYTDPNTFLSMFITGGGHNRTGWSHAGYDALIAKAARETDDATRLRHFRAAEAILMDESPILALYYYNYQNLVSTRLKGHIDNPLNLFDFRIFTRVRE